MAVTWSDDFRDLLMELHLAGGVMGLQRIGWYAGCAIAGIGAGGFAAFCVVIPLWAQVCCWPLVVAAAAREGLRRSEEAQGPKIVERSGAADGSILATTLFFVGFWSWAWSGLPGLAGGPVALCALVVFEGLQQLLRPHGREAQAGA